MPNPEWCPFTNSICKNVRNAESTPNKNEYQCSQQACEVLFGIISSFYKYLLQDEIVYNKSVLLLRQFVSQEIFYTGIQWKQHLLNTGMLTAE